MLQYYYYDPLKTRKGPYTLQELRTLKATGVIDDITPVQVEGGGKEIRFRDLEKLQSGTDQPPAPSRTSLPPAEPARSTPPPAHGGSSIKVPLLLVGVPLVLFIVGAIIVGAGLLIWFGTAPKFSAADDEIQSVAKRTSDFVDWRQQISTLAQGNSLTDGKAPEKIGWWAKRNDLPPDAAAEAALNRKLPSDVELSDIQLKGYQTNADNTALTYEVTVKPKQSLALVTTAPIKLSDPAFKNYQVLGKYLIAAPDLPAGQSYVEASRKVVAEKNNPIRFDWTIRRASKADGVWKILDSEPTPFDIDPNLEQQLQAQGNPNTPLLRSEAVLNQAAQQQNDALNALQGSIQQIDTAVASYKNQAYTGVPGQPTKDNSKFGGSGSGEPTKTGVRVVGGAAGGAAIGAIAGGGEGAGWGALGGAVVGGVYDAVSKSNDKKKFEQEKQARYQAQANARASAQRQAANALAAYQKSLVAELETNMKTAAEAHNSRLGLVPKSPTLPTSPELKVRPKS